MPESKGRKPKPKKSTPKPPRQPLTHTEAPWQPRPRDERSLEFTPPNRDPIRELTEEEQFELPELPEEASYEQVLVALANLDPLEQEVLIAQRISAMPSQKDGGMPVNISRHVRPGWARQLRKLGIFCIPELATHELVADPAGGIMANHTAGRLRKLSTEDFWEMAKQQNPELGAIVDNADTPEKRKEAMQQLARSLPVELRIAFDRLLTHDPNEFEPR